MARSDSPLGLCYSWNKTAWKLRRLADAEIEVFGAPLMICGSMIVMEEIFWSPVFEMWIYLVSEHTARRFPPESRCREMTLDEVPYYMQLVEVLP